MSGGIIQGSPTAAERAQHEERKRQHVENARARNLPLDRDCVTCLNAEVDRLTAENGDLANEYARLRNMLDARPAKGEVGGRLVGHGRVDWPESPAEDDHSTRWTDDADQRCAHGYRDASNCSDCPTI